MIERKTFDDASNNPYLQILYEIYNRIWELRDFNDDLAEMKRQMKPQEDIVAFQREIPEMEADLILRGYSTPRDSVSIKNIELEPITFKIAKNIRGVDVSGSGDRWVHISTEYPAGHEFIDESDQDNETLNAWIERVPVRVEVYLRQDDNIPDKLTERAYKIANDMRLALADDYFTALPIADPFHDYSPETLLEYVDGAEFRGPLEAQEPQRRALQDLIKRYAKYVSSESSLLGYRIRSAGIEEWGPVNNFRGTNEEILIFIFEYQLVSYLNESLYVR